MSELLKINVNDHTEKKNGLTYLSWAWAWAEVLKLDPKARWHAVEYGNEQGCALPAMFLPDGSAMVKTEVTIKGETKVCTLPVMDHRNKAIKNPDAFAINTAIMRCMTKTISMHGLGLYLYAGEDLPEGEEKPENDNGAPGALIFRELQPDIQTYLRKAAPQIDAVMPNIDRAHQLIEMCIDNWPDADHQQVKIGLWHLLDSKTRSALKKSATS